MADWKQRALAATRGTQLGAVLHAATRTECRAPCFGRVATITSDGFVMADFTSANGERHMGAFVGSSSDLVRNSLGLADHLSLDNEARSELFKAVRGWVTTDYSNGNVLKKLEVE